MAAPSINDILQHAAGPTFKPRTDVPAPWTLLEYKSLNTHRGLFCWRPGRALTSTAAIGEAVRQAVKDYVRARWWCGFAFGVVIDAPSLPPDLASLMDQIDTRARRAGVWQWTIAVDRSTSVALGMHTWMLVRLTPIYIQVLNALERQGLSVGDFKKDKDRLMKFLTNVGTLGGLRGGGLPEYQPEDRDDVTG